MKESEHNYSLEEFRQRWYRIIFKSDTPPGKTFDVLLLIAIIISIFTLMLESISTLADEYRYWFYVLEWIFTGIFTLEYIARIWVVNQKWKYITSFYGIIDLLAIIPTYLAIFLVGAQYFMVIRSLRLLRAFRVLKMVRFMGEAQMLSRALKASRIKITVFLISVICLVFIIGAMMYIIEGPENGFTSIPVSIYWCIVTLTTVGYGDISPQTPLGQILASITMIMGYGIIAVPTGIVTSELSRASSENYSLKRCPACNRNHHTADAVYCKYCGNLL